MCRTVLAGILIHFFLFIFSMSQNLSISSLWLCEFDIIVCAIDSTSYLIRYTYIKYKAILSSFFFFFDFPKYSLITFYIRIYCNWLLYVCGADPIDLYLYMAFVIALIHIYITRRAKPTNKKFVERINLRGIPMSTI